MRITVFGATGRTGRELVRQALGRGFTVVAYVRDTQRVDIEESGLTVVPGELNDRERVTTAIKGSDCVVSALGPTGKPSDEELSAGIANILWAMQECDVARFIVLSTTSDQDSHDIDGVGAKTKRAMVRRSRPISYEQIVRYSQLVRDSSRDWTLVRITAILTDKPLSRQVKAGYVGRDRFRATLSRTSLACFMLDQVNSMQYLRQAPAVSD